MLSGARFSIQGLAAVAGAASRANPRAATASRRMEPTVSAPRRAGRIHIRMRVHPHDLAVREPDVDRGVLLDVDSAGHAAAAEADPDGDHTVALLELERLEGQV